MALAGWLAACLPGWNGLLAARHQSHSGSDESLSSTLRRAPSGCDDSFSSITKAHSKQRRPAPETETPRAHLVARVEEQATTAGRGQTNNQAVRPA
ncbi:hypothetical protein GGTG_00700 [Gaeumannomyces tritici R3-111a-1]|uniref:Secreted protein n=1 Tax=Gaeumannomyces tritici (strain R3-111a-1) TaxID=644352 RepID=J3NHG3_GAET3|nr:hypothetical protein GGTG_00700 [Gaeumannomyces tritici R3-111a-1]EJT80706.1 hypothetical protein GGTG_00700 [Gaeumannomyces tritici R3-111a-1]